MEDHTEKLPIFYANHFHSQNKTRNHRTSSGYSQDESNHSKSIPIGCK